MVGWLVRWFVGWLVKRKGKEQGLRGKEGEGEGIKKIKRWRKRTSFDPRFHAGVFFERSQTRCCLVDNVELYCTIPTNACFSRKSFHFIELSNPRYELRTMTTRVLGSPHYRTLLSLSLSFFLFLLFPVLLSRPSSPYLLFVILKKSFLRRSIIRNITGKLGGGGGLRG